MGVLTARPETAIEVRPLTRWPIYCVFTIYVALTGITVFYHEPWSDEANSWLLGRDASLFELWTRLMHYEGTPGVWQTILHILIRLGFPYAGLNYFSGALGCAAAWVFMCKAQLPLVIRLAMPFTFYLFYQYSVVARSYALLPLLLFLCASIYPRAREQAGRLTLLLCLMAGVSVHGMLIAGAIWISFHWQFWRRWRETGYESRKKLLVLGFIYAATNLLLVWSAWPAKDALFASERDYSFGHLLNVTGETLANAFTGEWISSLVLVALCVPFLWRGRGLLMFSIAALSLCAFNAFVYANVWHEGMPFLAWLFAMWISGKAAKAKWIQLSGVFAMAAVIVVQGYWAFETTTFDWMNPYSGSRAAARYLRDHQILKSKLYGLGFACVGIQPYFARNIFSNFRDGEPQSYYDWSSAYRNFEGADDLAETKPDYVIVGYKDEEEKILTRSDVKKSGYRMIEHFEGNIFWHNQILEPDAFDLYRRIGSE